MNKLTIIGNLTRDPELRATKNGDEVCNFTVAVNRRGGNGPDDADFFHVTAWNKLAKNCQNFLAKGRKVCVVGPVSVKVSTKDGKTYANLEMVAQDVEFLTARKEREADPTDAYGEEGRDAGEPYAGYTAVETDELPF